MSEEVRSMFAAIAPRYDLMNSVITLGMHHRWRRRTVELAKAHDGESVLDCAAGTGDLAFEFKRSVGSHGRVLATDFCAEMLEGIAPKSKSLQLTVEVELADAMKLPYADQSFDIVSIAYGIRNVDDPRVALREMARVLKPGGRIAVLETGQPKGIMALGYAVFRRLIPLAGRLVASNSDAYTYLPATAAKFPYGEEFVAMLREIPDIVSARAYPLFFGVSYIYIATKRS